MLKLIKYELARKLNLLIISLVALVGIELFCIFGIHKGGAYLALAIFIMFLLGFGGLIVIFVDSIVMYSSDLYKKPGYMLFLTPNSSFKIIGSKLVVSIIEGLVVFGIYVLMWLLNYKLIYNLYYGSIDQTARGLIEAFAKLLNLPSAGDIIMLLLSIVVSWFSLIITVYLAITIRKTLLANVKFGGLFSFILFVVIYGLTTYVHTQLINNVDAWNAGLTQMDSLVNSVTISSLIFSSIIGVFMYICSSILLSKGVDL